MSKATIVIPNINGKGWLKDSIESIYAQTEQDFDLIVVDNGSTDESLEQARSYCTRPNFTLIENGRNTGFSYAVNQGIARAQSKYVVLFNNDAFAEPQWLAELLRTADADPKIFAVQSLMIRHFERELADDAGDYVTIDFILDERARELMGEMHRWYDLKRTDKLMERMNDPEISPMTAGKFKDYHVLRPIPRDQLTNVSNPEEFTQNPGYGN